MTHMKSRSTVVYRKYDKKKGIAKLTSVRLSPAASVALEEIKAQFAKAYPEDRYPSLSLCIEKAVIEYAASVKFDHRTLNEAVAEMKAAGYPVNNHSNIPTDEKA
jgi:hypothetical protein